MGNKHGKLAGKNVRMLTKSRGSRRHIVTTPAISSDMHASSASITSPIPGLEDTATVEELISNKSNSSRSTFQSQSSFLSNITTNTDSTRNDFATVSFSGSEKRFPDPVVCFLSLFYLHQNWTSIPPDVLKTSIVMFYCRREWVFQSTKPAVTRCTRNNRSIVNMIEETDLSNDSTFLELLRFKEKQGRLLWIDPCMDTNVSVDDTTDDWHIDERWHMISRFLTQFRDPITGDHYENLEFNLEWWQKKFDRTFELITKTGNQELNFADIVSPLEYCQHLTYIQKELTNMKWNFKCVLEILSQSVPTLLPMIAYDSDRIQTKKGIYESVLFTPDNIGINSETIQTSKALRTTFLIEDDEGMVYLQ